MGRAHGFESLEGDDAWHCDALGRKVPAIKRATMAAIPEVLLLGLSRVRFVDGARVKVMHGAFEGRARRFRDEFGRFFSARLRTSVGAISRAGGPVETLSAAASGRRIATLRAIVDEICGGRSASEPFQDSSRGVEAAQLVGI